jgi:hypothetical protein
MRRTTLVGCLLTLVVGGAAMADEAPPVPGVGPEQTTTVRGTVPDLAGRWLGLAWLNLPGGTTRTNVAVWEVRTREGRPEVVVRFVGLPAAEQAALDAANQTKAPWYPTAADVARVAAAWESLPAREVRPQKVETVLTGADAFDEALRTDLQTSGARWIAQQTETPDPANARTSRQAHIYAVKDAVDGGWKGAYTTVVVAAAPFPVPITFRGSFQLFRLDPRPGFLARLLDTLRGCGRR